MRALRCSAAPSIWTTRSPKLWAGPPAAPLRQGSTRSRSTGRFLALAGSMLVLAVLSQQPWAAGARGTAKSVLAPLEAQMTSIASTAGRATAMFGDIASLRAENQRLSAENQALRRPLAELAAAASAGIELPQA